MLPVLQLRWLLFQLSRQQRGQAEAASGGLSLPDVAAPALCWCNTRVLLLDSVGSCELPDASRSSVDTRVDKRVW